MIVMNEYIVFLNIISREGQFILKNEQCMYKKTINKYIDTFCAVLSSVFFNKNMFKHRNKRFL